jgi:hypothetical protein
MANTYIVKYVSDEPGKRYPLVKPNFISKTTFFTKSMEIPTHFLHCSNQPEGCDIILSGDTPGDRSQLFF